MLGDKEICLQPANVDLKSNEMEKMARTEKYNATYPV